MTTARSTRLVYEISARGLPHAQAGQFAAVSLAQANPGSNRSLVSQFWLEVLIPNVKPFMPLIFPTLPGRDGVDIVKRQKWSTNVQTHVSGRRITIGYWQYPIWEWDLSYSDYLPDNGWRNEALRSHFKVLLNFIGAVQGQCVPFLFYDRDDNYVAGQMLGVGDGLTTDFPLMRSLGQPDPLLIERAFEDRTIPASGPYTIAPNYAGLFVNDLSVQFGNYVRLAKVTGAPGPQQYSVSGGVYTFHSSDATKDVWLLYDHYASPLTEPIGFLDIARPLTVYVNGSPATNYVVNQTTFYDQVISFNVGPHVGDIITADIPFFHVCNLGDDVAEFTQVIPLMWSNKKLTISTARPMKAF